MPSKQKINNELIKKFLAMGTVSHDVGDYSKEPFFIKKTEAAKKRIERTGFPSVFTAKK